MGKHRRIAMTLSTFGLLLILVGVSYSFFNYTRTGSTNIIKVGKISFNSTQNNSINLVNVFPIASNEVTGENANYDEVMITITGDTTYVEGVEYVLTVTDLNNIIISGSNEKEIPISVNVETSGELGISDDDYFDNRGGNSSIYKNVTKEILENDSRLLVGYIKPDLAGINGNISVKAYIDKDKIAISDTYIQNSQNSPYLINPNMTQSELQYCINNMFYFDNPIVNPNSTQAEINSCAQNLSNYNFDDYLQEGESLNTFCAGTGTFQGLTLQQIVDQHIWSQNEIIEFLNMNILIIQDNNHEYENFCRGTGQYYETFFQQVIDNNYISSGAITNFLNHNVIIDKQEYMGTTDEWVNGRTVLTTDEWNSLQANGVSFKIKVEANEGIWVSDLSILANEISRKVGKTNYVKSYNREVLSTNPTFTTQDTVGVNNNKLDVNYYTGSDAYANSNVLFAGFCWQIVRTTDTGGVKLMYNGLPVDNKCDFNRMFLTTKGVVGFEAGSSSNLSNTTVFGRNYDFDLETGMFTIEDTSGLPTSWNENTYQDLRGTYTCLGNSTTCDSIYNLGYAQYDSNYVDYVVTAKYIIRDVNSYFSIGESSFNLDGLGSIGLSGYMYNSLYPQSSDSLLSNVEYHTYASWDGTKYILTSQDEAKSVPDITHQYVCEDSSCVKIRFYFKYNNYSSKYIKLENGQTIETFLKHVFNYKSNPSDSDTQINVYDSLIKGYVDNWYRKYLTEYTSYLDGDTVYCNDRSIESLGVFGPDGTDISGNTPALIFNLNYSDTNLKCENVTDRFAVSNNSAKLTYPIGLLTKQEVNLMQGYVNKNDYGDYWTMTPQAYQGTIYNYLVNPQSNVGSYMNSSNSVRPVITLKPGIKYTSGSGTTSNPYVVGL